MRRIFSILFCALIIIHGTIALTKSLSGDSEKFENFNPRQISKNLAIESQQMAPLKVFAPTFTAQTFAPSRQVLGTVYTINDLWHNTCNGRQIAYAGYYNDDCDYIYMDWQDNYSIGSSQLRQIDGAFFDWSFGDWDFTLGKVQISIVYGGFPQMAAVPGTGQGMAVYHCFPGNGNKAWSFSAFAGSCPDNLDTWSADSLPGPPNDEAVTSGFCGDVDAEISPYIWPHHDVDTNAAGETVVHVATNMSDCRDAPDGVIDVSSLIYYRKVGSGSWDGPHFIDSAYLISQLVVADKTSSNVYYCYLKPVWYQTGTVRNPCDPDGASVPGYYQLLADVAYYKSTNDGQTWTEFHKITDYAEGWAEGLSDPARYDLSALVDSLGVLHLVWWGNEWFKDEADANICGSNSGAYYIGKLWHYDDNNDCISVAYDASHPVYFSRPAGKVNGGQSTFMATCTKPNISWCDSKLYISFMRYGANPVGDTSFEYGAGDDQDTIYQIADIMVVGSDASGNMGKTWTDGINLTQTPGDSCLPGACDHEVWPSMAMYSHDSLMIHYLNDKDPGIWRSREEGVQTNNPVMFMTWPCFTMNQAGTNACMSVNPSNPTYAEIALAPNGSTVGCTTPATYNDQLILSNCGNIDLNYSTSSNAAWLTVLSGASGSVSAGAGPRNVGLAGWNGKDGCADPATVQWRASSTTLGQGNYSGKITVNIAETGVDDFDITVNLVVACQYYLPEFADVTGGCWTIDLFNTPQAANGSANNNTGNMTYYTCGDDSTLHPLYTEALIIGWKLGSNLYCYTDNSDSHMGALLPASLPSYQRQNANMRALSGVTVSSVGAPASGTGFWHTTGYWCTPDSTVYGKTEYFIPGHQDTAVVIEKITLWNHKTTALTGFLVGEGIDWDVRRDSNRDAGDYDDASGLIYQYGSGGDADIYAGLAPYYGHDANYGGAVLDNPTWIYPDTGYHIVNIYNKLTSLDAEFEFFSDSLTDLNTVFRFKETTLGVNDTLTIIKIKAVSLNGLAGLQALITKGKDFIGRYSGIYTSHLDVNPDTVNLTYVTSSKAETNAVVATLSDIGGKSVSWTGSTNDGGLGWLVVTPNPLLGKTPSPITIDFNPTVAATLELGTYVATITFVSPTTPTPVILVVKLKVTDTACQGKCGDANSDGAVNVSDAVKIINYVFLALAAPNPLSCGDANSDGAVNVSDAVKIINYVFLALPGPTDCNAEAPMGGTVCCPF